MKTQYKVHLNGNYVADLPREPGIAELRDLNLQYGSVLESIVHHEVYGKPKQVIYNLTEIKR